MTEFDPAAYGTAIEQLLRRAPLNPLDAGQHDASARAALVSLSDDAFGPNAPRNRDMAAACRAGLWVRFNYLDESHKISQNIETPEGSFWHGIMHRREGDFDNAKYWFRRVGRHPVFEPLRQAAANVAGKAPGIPSLASHTEWDPFAFVDLCEKAVHGSAAYRPLCEDIQRREWELLFDYCWRNSV